MVLLAQLLRMDLGCREICGVKGKLNLGLLVGVKATASEQLSRRWVKSSGVLTMSIPSSRSSGRLINGSEHGFIDPFKGKNSGQFEGTTSEMVSSAKAMEFVYDPMNQTIWLGEQKGSVVLDFQPVRVDLCSTPLGYELVNSSIAISADLHFSARWQGEQISVTVDGALISVVTGGLDLAFRGRFIPYWFAMGSSHSELINSLTRNGQYLSFEQCSIDFLQIMNYLASAIGVVGVCQVACGLVMDYGVSLDCSIGSIGKIGCIVPLLGLAHGVLSLVLIREWQPDNVRCSQGKLLTVAWEWVVSLVGCCLCPVVGLSIWESLVA